MSSVSESDDELIRKAVENIKNKDEQYALKMQTQADRIGFLKAHAVPFFADFTQALKSLLNELSDHLNDLASGKAPIRIISNTPNLMTVSKDEEPFLSFTASLNTAGLFIHCSLVRGEPTRQTTTIDETVDYKLDIDSDHNFLVIDPQKRKYFSSGSELARFYFARMF